MLLGKRENVAKPNGDLRLKQQLAEPKSFRWLHNVISR